MKNKIIPIGIILCFTIITGLLGSFFQYIPDEVETIAGAKRYAQDQTLLIKSLNKELNTVFFFSLNATGILEQDKVYSPRFPGNIIFYSIQGIMTGEISSRSLRIISYILSIITCIIVGLLTRTKNKKNITILALIGGVSIYFFYSYVIYDILISTLLYLTGTYITFFKKNRIGHYFFIMSAWYRYEYILAYFLTFLLNFRNKKHIYIYILGLVATIGLIMSLQVTLKGELGLTRDRLTYITNETYDLSQDETAIEDSNSNAVSTGLRYLKLNSDSLHYRWVHLKYLIFRLNFISILIPLGWIFLLLSYKKKYISNIHLKFIFTSTLFILLAYGGGRSYYGFDVDVLHSSFVRYSLPLSLILAAIGGKYIFSQGYRLQLILIFIIGIISYEQFFLRQYPIHLGADRVRNGALAFAQRYEKNSEKIIWISSGGIAKILYLDYENQYSINRVPPEIVLSEIHKLQSEALLKMGYTILLMNNSKVLPKKIVPYIEYYFDQEKKENNITYFKMQDVQSNFAKIYQRKLNLKEKGANTIDDESFYFLYKKKENEKEHLKDKKIIFEDSDLIKN